MVYMDMSPWIADREDNTNTLKWSAEEFNIIIGVLQANIKETSK